MYLKRIFIFSSDHYTDFMHAHRLLGLDTWQKCCAVTRSVL